jgi:GxxExxY protein
VPATGGRDSKGAVPRRKAYHLILTRALTHSIVYDGARLDAGYRLDILVGDAVVVEVKAVEEIAPVYKSRLISDLKLGGFAVGLLINLNVVHLGDGIGRAYPHRSPSLEE